MLKRLVSAILSACAALLYALPVLAAAAEESNKEGLPQFDTALFPEQLVWLAVNFAILYVLMAFVALPLVRRTQDQRAGTIAADIAAAQTANESAKNMMAKYEKALADARAKAQGEIAEISANMAKESAARQAAQQQELAQRLTAAEARIASARDAAITEVKGKAADLANVIVEKVAPRGSSHAA